MGNSEVARLIRGELPDWTVLSLPGAGAGAGDGDGYGYGYGDGAGYGAGDGDGYGYGDGAGYGAGDGDGAYYQALFDTAKQAWPAEQTAILHRAIDECSALAFWKSDKDGKPSNGGKSRTTAAPGVVEEIDGPLEICTPRALHATMQPDKWKGERLWVVALYGEVQWQDDKCAALKREIIGEVEFNLGRRSQ